MNSSKITLANGGLQPVRDGVLGTWDTTGAAADTYQIFVTQIFTNNTSVFKSTRIVVDSTLRPGWPIDMGLLSNGIASLGITNHLNAADVDGNGTKEIIVGYNTKVSIVDHTGAQLPGWPQTIDPQNSGAHIQISPAVADLDGDAALCDEALRLGRVLVQLLPGESEVHALVALMELNASRTAARRGSNGEAVLLPDQDRSLWDDAQIQRGMSALEHAQRLGRGTGYYALQLAIAACHMRARTAAETDWQQIVLFYDALMQTTPSPHRGTESSSRCEYGPRPGRRA